MFDWFALIGWRQMMWCMVCVLLVPLFRERGVGVGDGVGVDVGVARSYCLGGLVS